MKRKTIASLLIAGALVVPGFAYAAIIDKIPTTGCEIAAFLGFVNIKQCEDTTW